jgi:RNA polymerase sigma-70 factor (ECF subfamily)
MSAARTSHLRLVRPREDAAPGSAAARDPGRVRAAQQGDGDAWAELYDLHAPYLHGVLLNVLGPDEEIGDVLQEVFLEAVRGIGRLENPSRLRDWLVTIAVYRARALIRRRRRFAWLRFGGATEDDEPEGGLASDVDGAMRALYRVLYTMPADDRVVFALRYVAGFELVEVAEARGVSLATIKRWLRRAETTFLARARREPALASSLESSTWERR